MLRQYGSEPTSLPRTTPPALGNRWQVPQVFFGIFFFHRNLLGHRIVLEFSSVWEGGEDVRLSRARVWESSA